MGKFIDLTGQKFGRLTVLGRSDFSVPRRGVFWKCQCECGNIVDAESGPLRTGAKKSCGCWYKERLVGKRFGRLTVLEFARTTGKEKDAQYIWKCRCDCGNIKYVRTGNLMNGDSTSCGCYNQERKTKHSISDTKIYKAYYRMIDRCYNPKNKAYKDYGGRGIVVCDEWRTDDGSFEFYKWAVNNGWKDGLSLDRIDVNGNYEPSNCRWTSSYVQMNNTRRNRYVEINGEKHTVTQWAKILDMNPRTIFNRLERGWSDYDAVAKKTVKKKKVERDNNTSLYHEYFAEHQNQTR